jgi:two-component system, chemotaxis family, chemotaxis protein CheY
MPGMGQPWVLLVDDHDDGRELLGEFLTIRGMDVECRSSAEAALECIAKRGAPSVLITDLTLGHMSGSELARQLRAGKDTAGTPILAVTGHATFDDPEGLFAEVLVKPVALEVLSDAVLRLLPR